MSSEKRKAKLLDDIPFAAGRGRERLVGTAAFLAAIALSSLRGGNEEVAY